MSFFRLQLKRTFANIRTWIIIALITLVIPYGVITLSTVEDDGYIYHLALMDEDNTELSKDFYESIKGSAGMTIVEDITYDEAMRELNLGNIDIIYVIKEGFEERIKEGKYRDLIRWTQSAETVSTSWMNDQLSVGVIRYWLKTDIVKRIQAVDSSFTYEKFLDEFDESYDNNQLIDHQVIVIEGDELKSVQSKPLAEVYFFNVWGIFALVWIWLQNRIIIDDTKSNIISRMKLTEGASLSYYATRLFVQVITLTIPWLITFLYMSQDQFSVDLSKAIAMPLYIVVIFLLSIATINFTRSKKSYTMIGYVFILINVVFSSDLISGFMTSTELFQKILPLYHFIN